MKKRIFSIIMMVMMIVIIAFPSFAAENVNNSDNDIIISYAEKCFSSNTYEVVDQDGNSVGNAANRYAYQLYNTGDFSELKSYLLTNEYALAYSTCEDSVARAFTAKNFKYEKYFIATDTKKKFTKEWTTILKSSFVYNANTYVVTSAKSPTLSIGTANFGASFSPRIDDVNTSYKISSDKSKVTFTATYKMKATLGVSLGNLPLGFNLDFGNHTQSKSVTP